MGLLHAAPITMAAPSNACSVSQLTAEQTFYSGVGKMAPLSVQNH
ncbi:MAG: hypothetical protein AB7L92_02615 [Alphaproteobacteria bacterium]